jgi:hypothetical protein
MQAPKSTLETLEEEDDDELEDGTENLWPENPDQITCGRAHRVKKDRENHVSTLQAKLDDLSNFTTTSKISIKSEQSDEHIWHDWAYPKGACLWPTFPNVWQCMSPERWKQPTHDDQTNTRCP